MSVPIPLVSRQSSRFSFPVLVLIALLGLAALACSLQRAVDVTEEPVYTPTFVPTATPPPGATVDASAPTVQIVEPQPGLQVERNQEVNVRASTQHETGATQALLYVAVEGSDDEPTIAGSVTLPETPESDAEFTWEPDEEGSYVLSVVALRGAVQSEPATVSVVVRSEGALPRPPTPTLGPCTVTTLSTLALRGGPGTTFPRLADLQAGETLDVIGQNNDRSGQGWFKARRTNGREGWVNSSPEFVEAQGGCSIVPVVQP